MHETLSKFIKDGENLDMILSSQWDTYNKVSLCYESKINAKNFSNIYNANKSSDRNMLKCNYYNKNGYIYLFWFVRKIQESNNDYSLSHFYIEYLASKMRNVFASSYFSDDNSKT